MGLHLQVRVVGGGSQADLQLGEGGDSCVRVIVNRQNQNQTKKPKTQKPKNKFLVLPTVPQVSKNCNAERRCLILETTVQ